MIWVWFSVSVVSPGRFLSIVKRTLAVTVTEVCSLYRREVYLSEAGQGVV